MVTSTPATRFFFVHLMKTGGTSFVSDMLRNFEPDEAYPNAVDLRFPGDILPYWSVPHLLALTAERRARIRVYTGHLPYLASELLGLDVVRLTLLRNPIDRTVSMLKHAKRLFEGYASLALDEIYEDPHIFKYFIENYQTNAFAITAEERDRAMANPPEVRDGQRPLAVSVPEDHTRRAAIAARRFERAKSTLAKVDVVGLNENYEAFLHELSMRFGWWPNGLPKLARMNVSSEDWTASPALRRRIAHDLTTDMEFYEYARELVATRRWSS
jgi:hypothetical protein